MGRATARRKENKYKLELKKKKILNTVEKKSLFGFSSPIFPFCLRYQNNNNNIVISKLNFSILFIASSFIYQRKTYIWNGNCDGCIYDSGVSTCSICYQHYVTAAVGCFATCLLSESIDRSLYFDMTACCCTVTGGLLRKEASARESSSFLRPSTLCA
jgi:hypothetical protein